MVILAVGREDGQGEDVCGDEWQAVVRKEDVRATEKEKVVCGDGFRVGDVVRGVVVRCISAFSFLLPFFFVSSSSSAGGWEKWDLVPVGEAYRSWADYHAWRVTDQSGRSVQLLPVYREE